MGNKTKISKKVKEDLKDMIGLVKYVINIIYKSLGLFYRNNMLILKQVMNLRLIYFLKWKIKKRNYEEGKLY